MTLAQPVNAQPRVNTHTYIYSHSIQIAHPLAHIHLHHTLILYTRAHAQRDVIDAVAAQHGLGAAAPASSAVGSTGAAARDNYYADAADDEPTDECSSSTLMDLLIMTARQLSPSALANLVDAAKALESKKGVSE